MPYTTQGYMTAADMADLAELHDWNIGEAEAKAEEEAMEAAHAAHADECPACQEEATQRETGARVALQMDTARRALIQGIQKALGLGVIQPPLALHQMRVHLEEALKEAEEAIRAI